MSFRILSMLALIALLSACSTTEPLITYDGQGRVIKKTDETTGEVTEWEYDKKNRLSTIRSSKGTVKHFYNDKGLLTKIEKQPDGIVCKFGYTADGNLETFTDPAGNITKYIYDGNGKLTEKILPDGTIEKNPKPPESSTALMQPKKKKYQYNKQERPKKIEYQSSVNSYKIPGQYKYKN